VACNLAIRAAISSAAAFRARSAFLGAALAGVPALWPNVDPAVRTAFFGGGVFLAANVLVAGGILFGTTFRTTGPPDVRTAGGFFTGGTGPASFAIGGVATGGTASAPFATTGSATRGLATRFFATGGFGDGGVATVGTATGGSATASFTTGGLATGGFATGGFATGGFARGGFGDGKSVTASFAIGDVTVGDTTVGDTTVGDTTVGDTTVGDTTVAPGDRFVAIGNNTVGISSTAWIGLCRSAGSGVVVFAIGESN
jgi:hypothetical protein